MCVRHSGRDKGDLVIRLLPLEEPPPAPPAPAPIPIPDTLRGCHPVIRVAREAGIKDRGWIDNRHNAGQLHLLIRKQNLGRALLIVQALINEAERRGYSVSIGSGYDCKKGGLRVGINGHSYELVVKEPQRRVPHIPTKDELERHRRYDWAKPPPWDLVPSDRLEIRLGHDTYSSPLSSDRDRWRLEDRLSLIFSKLEKRAAEDEIKRLEAERKATEARRQWEAIRAAAIEQVHEDHRVRWLNRQLRLERKARGIRDYVERLRTARVLTSEEEQWLQWVERHAATLDPLTSEIVPAPRPEPKPKELQPYMQGWNATEPKAPFTMFRF